MNEYKAPSQLCAYLVLVFARHVLCYNIIFQGWTSQFTEMHSTSSGLKSASMETHT